MAKKQKVAIVIPAYNEEKVIGKVINDLQKTIKPSRFAYTIIVVNDGSTDNTARIAKQSGAYVINHILNIGSGGATATGLSYAYQNGFDVAATVDGDGQHKAADVMRGINLLTKSDTDLLIGSRLIDSKGMSRVKVLGNTGLSLITYLVFGVRVTDSQSGLRILSKNALNRLRWKTSGYEFCSEMLWRAKQQQLIIKEYPIEAIYTIYSKAKGQNNWSGVEIVRFLIQRRLLEFFSE